MKIFFLLFHNIKKVFQDRHTKPTGIIWLIQGLAGIYPAIIAIYFIISVIPKWDTWVLPQFLLVFAFLYMLRKYFSVRKKFIWFNISLVIVTFLVSAPQLFLSILMPVILLAALLYILQNSFSMKRSAIIVNLSLSIASAVLLLVVLCNDIDDILSDNGYWQTLFYSLAVMHLSAIIILCINSLKKIAWLLAPPLSFILFCLLCMSYYPAIRFSYFHYQVCSNAPFVAIKHINNWPINTKKAIKHMQYDLYNTTTENGGIGRMIIRSPLATKINNFTGEKMPSSQQAIALKKSMIDFLKSPENRNTPLYKSITKQLGGLPYDWMKC